jgi:hypothetical protein
MAEAEGGMKNLEPRWFHHSACFLLHSPRRFQIVAAINDAGVQQRGGAGGGLWSAGFIPLQRTLGC